MSLLLLLNDLLYDVLMLMMMIVMVRNIQRSHESLLYCALLWIPSHYVIFFLSDFQRIFPVSLSSPTSHKTQHRRRVSSFSCLRKKKNLNENCCVVWRHSEKCRSWEFDDVSRADSWVSYFAAFSILIDFVMNTKRTNLSRRRNYSTLDNKRRRLERDSLIIIFLWFHSTLIQAKEPWFYESQNATSAVIDFVASFSWFHDDLRPLFITNI